jgi:outer membrane protein assembly factor BamB
MSEEVAVGINRKKYPFPVESMLQLALISAVLFVARPCAADMIVGWRGDGTGRFERANPPTEWAADKNIVWRAELPKWSNASPVLSQGRLFVCAEPDILICVDAESGQILWQATNGVDQLLAEEFRPLIEEVRRLNDAEQKLHKKSNAKPTDEDLKQELADFRKNLAEKRKPLDDALGEGFDFSLPRAHGSNGYTSPTPVSDGRMVWVLFGSGVAAAYDLEGTRQWIRFVERPVIGQGHCSSPLLLNDKLIVHVGKIHALNAKSGATVWTAKSGPRFGTPVVAVSGDRTIVVTANGEMLDAGDGEVLASGLSRLAYNAPLVDGDVAYFFNNGEARAYRIPSFDVDDPVPEMLWSTKVSNDRHYASPVISGGRVLCLSQKGMLTVLDSESGDKALERDLKLQGTCYPSPTLAGPYIYFGGEGGATVVLNDDASLEQVAYNTLDKYRSSPVFDGERMYVRGMKALYCIAADK